jgi:hypothetical protein
MWISAYVGGWQNGFGGRLVDVWLWVEIVGSLIAIADWMSRGCWFCRRILVMGSWVRVGIWLTLDFDVVLVVEQY